MSKKSIFLAILLISVGIIFGAVLVTHFQSVDLGFAGGRDVKIGANQSVLKETRDVQKIEEAFITVSKAVTPAVVSVKVKVKRGGGSKEFEQFFRFWGHGFEFPQPKPEEGSGSGVIVTDDGYIITNYHVVKDADQNGIDVVLYDKRRMKAKLIGTDPLTDLAVIKIEGSNLPVAVLGNSDSIQVGQWVLAIGNPFNLYSTVTHGIISALGRGSLGIIRDPEGYGVEDFIQTDAAINPGNSGGALVNLRGEVIGINTAIATTNFAFQGYGFALPINLAKSVAEELIRYGKVNRGYIGIRIQTIDATTANALGLEKPQGVLIQGLVEGGAAEAAGLKQGDVILSVDGKPVNESNELQAYVARKHPGDKVTLTIFREGKKFDKVVTLKPRREAKEEARTAEERGQPEKDEERVSSTATFDNLGFAIKSLDEETRRTREVKNGVLVTEVQPMSEAAKRGLLEGDIILEIDRQKINSVSEVSKILKTKKAGSALMLRVKGTDNTVRLVFFEIPE